MKRIAFVFRALPNERLSALDVLKAQAPAIAREAEMTGIDNFSVWGVEDVICGYGECGGGAAFRLPDALTKALEGRAELICPPGTMRLMYHDIGVVRQDKSLIRHRVFITKLKPGCEEEYKRRHDALIEARGDAVCEGPDSNFTIWNGAGYIFGYCEKVKSFDHDMTAEEKESTVAWETRQLEIMDWLTDDVDWITGEKHDPIQRVV